MTDAISPKLQLLTERDIAPVVVRPRKGLSAVAAASGIIAAGAMLFGVLDARRRSLSTPAVDRSQTEALQAPPQPLYVPPYQERSFAYAAPVLAPSATNLTQIEPQGAFRSTAPFQRYQPPLQNQYPSPPAAFRPQMQANAGAPLILDVTRQGEPVGAGAENSTGTARDSSRNTARTRAGIIANRSTTVAQGTIVPAVLETALDTSNTGFARALVQRDIRGFDGTRILIPRGSRLIGEYQSNTSSGQKRAFINWVRLIRPDGGTIALGSPATDTVGKGGVRANVNSHFFERFSGAILQSALDVGVNLAAQSAGGSTVLALPGSFSGTGQSVAPAQIPPTLSVRQGSSVSVFVARDLDFTDIEEGS